MIDLHVFVLPTFELSNQLPFDSPVSCENALEYYKMYSPFIYILLKEVTNPFFVLQLTKTAISQR